jgi:hypothetical protein
MRWLLVFTPGDAPIQHHADIVAGFARRLLRPAALVAAFSLIAGCLDFGGGPVQLPDGDSIELPEEGDGATDPAPDGVPDTEIEPPLDPAEDFPVDEPAEDLGPVDPTPEDLPADDGPPPPTENCGNGIDDDGDGKVDCMDDGCLAASVCEGTCYPTQTITCDAEIFARNDDPGSTDRIFEFECIHNGGYEGPEIAYEFTNPAHGKVYIGLEEFRDDLDIYLLDPGRDLCDTSDCVDHSNNEEGYDELIDVNLDPGTYYIVVDGWDGTVSGFHLWIHCTDIEICDNHIDDDEDEDTDCEDSECRRTPACPEPEDCDNRFDDDFDGATDCADSDCATDPDCLPPENCSNGVDDDGDTIVDCADTDCAADPACVP